MQQTSDDGSTGSTGPAVFEEQAIVYSTWSLSTLQSEIWLRRRGEDPVLVEAVDGEYANAVCMRPGSATYVLWETRDDGSKRLRVQTLRVDAETVSVDAEPSFPAGWYPVGCPVGWGPDGFFVNLTTQDTFDSGVEGTPHLITDDGDALPVPDARAAWEQAGRYAIERRALLDESDGGWFGEALVWDLRAEEATPITRWVAPEGLRVEVEGPWLVATHRGIGTSIVPLERPTDPPLVLTEDATADADVGFSPSGEYAVILDVGEGDAWVEVLRLGDGAVLTRWVGAPFAEVDRAYVSDRGIAGLSVQGSNVAYAVPVEGEVQMFHPGEDHRYVGVRLVDTLDAVLVRRHGGELDTMSLKPLSGAEVPLPDLDDCEVSIIDSTAIGHCRDGSFVSIDLAHPEEGAVSLADLAPADDAVGGGAVKQVWADEVWHEIVFHRPEDGYLSVLLHPQTRETVGLYHPGRLTSRRVYLPVSED